MNNQLSDIEKKYQKQQSVTGRFMTRFRLGLKHGIWKTVVASSYVLKRAMDILASLMAIIMLSPVFLVTWLAIKLEDPGPSIFKQERVGRWGKTFTMFKFRSMVMDAEKLKKQLMDQNESEAGVIFKMKKDPRITRVGSFIRKYSIDELPQLFNVLNGDMSLVGPRPPVPAEVQEYSLADRRRLDVTPGITCIWQVSGRNNIPFEQWMKMDMQYIDTWSLKLDIIILLKTIKVVFKGDGQ